MRGRVKRLVVLIVLLVAGMAGSLQMVAFADNPFITANVALDNIKKKVTVSGNISWGEGQQVTIKVINPAGAVEYIGQTTSGYGGSYSFSYTPKVAREGTYEVTVSGTEVKSAKTVSFRYEFPTPTATPTATPTPTPTPSTPAYAGGEGGAGPVKKDKDNKARIEKDAVIVETGVKVDAASGAAVAKLDSTVWVNVVKLLDTNKGEVKNVKVEIPEVKGANSYRLEIPKAAVALEENKYKIEVVTPVGTVQIPSNMFKKSEVNAVSNISISIGPADRKTLDNAVKSTIGDRPVIELNVTADGKAVSWNNTVAAVWVSIPYHPAENEKKNFENLTVWYINDNGKAVPVPSGKFDPETSTVTFKTTHFSKYGVAYVERTFDDLEAYQWAKKQVEVLAAKGIINGTAPSTYSPGAKISRADYIVLLVKTLELTAEIEDNFSDINKSDYFHDAVGTAKKLGISDGTGNNLFNPKAEITRQDMMTLTVRALRASGLQINGSVSAEVKRFSDANDIAAYARESIEILSREGLIEGNNGYITPLSEATRAETAVFMYRIYNWLSDINGYAD